MKADDGRSPKRARSPATTTTAAAAGRRADPGSPGGRPVRRPRPLPVSALYRHCPRSLLRFDTTADLHPTETIVGQERALEAIELAVAMAGPGYNVFAMGPPGIGKSTALQQLIAAHAATEPAPDDWCYVHDFADPRQPHALRLPPGRATDLRREMAELTAELPGALLAAFESDAYREQREALETRLASRRDEALSGLEERASAAGIAVVRTPVGLALAPTRGGRVLGPDEFHQLPDEEQATIRGLMSELGEQLESMLRNLPRWQRETRREVRQLDREVTAASVRHLVDDVRHAFSDLPAVLAYLDAVEADIVEHAAAILAVAQRSDGGPPGPPGTQPMGSVQVPSPDADGMAETGPMAGEAVARDASVPLQRDAPARTAANVPAAVELAGPPAPDASLAPGADEDGVLRRYGVNVLVDRSGQAGAPFVTEDLPTVANLTGRVEYLSRMGTLVTDFQLVRPGALHRANGGYLVLEAARVLGQPLAWEHLKRALRSGSIRVGSLSQALGLVTTVALEPEPIPLAVKVALVGERRLYYLLCALDPDVPELFKVVADFEDDVERSPSSVRAFATLIATLVQRDGLRPLDRSAVARAIEHLARMAEDATRLSTRMGRLADLLREADQVAGAAGRSSVSEWDVQAAIGSRDRREGRLRERLGEAMARGRIAIQTDGMTVGQVNALSVLQLGEASFGHPSRVTARVRIGHGDIVDIEREVELGGPIHSKGVLILAGFLAGRFGASPLALAASLVFEQTYGGVEGDSASLAELCALLSAIADLPLRQSMAVTGSVDQLGTVQAVGGVNDKIEGFFDVCAARGLTGSQGVIVPRANVDDLMLDERVVEAARAGRFHVWPVDSVDEAMTLLSGSRAGRVRPDGGWPAASVNGRVAGRLKAMADAARRWAKEVEPAVGT